MKQYPILKLLIIFITLFISTQSFAIEGEPVPGLNKLTNDTCDVIVRHDGVRIKGKVLSVEEKVIRYKECNHPDGPIREVKRSEVWKVIYKNGKESKFFRSEDLKVDPLAIIGVIAGVIGLLVAGLPLGFVALLLGIIAAVRIVAKKYKGTALAVISILIGFLDIVLVLVYLSSM